MYKVKLITFDFRNSAVLPGFTRFYPKLHAFHLTSTLSQAESVTMTSPEKGVCLTGRELKCARWFAAGLALLGYLVLGETVARSQVAIVQPQGIDFSNLTGKAGDPYLGSSQGGFAVTPTAGNWFQSPSYGNPPPSIYDGPVDQPGNAVLQITDGAGPFTFSSLSFSSNNGDSSYDIRAFLGANLEYEETGTLPGTFGPFSFSTLTIAHSTVAVDGLFIAVSPGAGVTSINLDNILVATIPEPGGVLTLALGFLSLSWLRRFLRSAR